LQLSQDLNKLIGICGAFAERNWVMVDRLSIKRVFQAGRGL